MLLSLRGKCRTPGEDRTARNQIVAWCESVWERHPSSSLMIRTWSYFASESMRCGECVLCFAILARSLAADLDPAGQKNSDTFAPTHPTTRRSLLRPPCLACGHCEHAATRLNAKQSCPCAKQFFIPRVAV